MRKETAVKKLKDGICLQHRVCSLAGSLAHMPFLLWHQLDVISVSLPSLWSVFLIDDF